jgi:hypothetical protein
MGTVLGFLFDLHSGSGFGIGGFAGGKYQHHAKTVAGIKFAAGEPAGLTVKPQRAFPVLFEDFAFAHLHRQIPGGFRQRIGRGRGRTDAVEDFSFHGFRTIVGQLLAEIETAERPSGDGELSFPLVAGLDWLVRQEIELA